MSVTIPKLNIQKVASENGDVIYSSLLPILDFNDILALRKTCRIFCSIIEDYFQNSLKYLVEQRAPELREVFKERLCHFDPKNKDLSATVKVISFYRELINNMNLGPHNMNLFLNNINLPFDTPSSQSFTYAEKEKSLALYHSLPKSIDDRKGHITPLIDYMRYLELFSQLSLLADSNLEDLHKRALNNVEILMGFLEANSYTKIFFQEILLPELLNNLKLAWYANPEDIKITRQFLLKIINSFNDDAAKSDLDKESKENIFFFLSKISEMLETGTLDIDAAFSGKIDKSHSKDIYNLKMKILINKIFPNLVKSNLIPLSIIFLTNIIENLNVPKIYSLMEEYTKILQTRGIFNIENTDFEIDQHTSEQLKEAYNMTPAELENSHIDANVITLAAQIKEFVNASKDTLGAIGLSVLLPAIAQILSKSSLAKDSENIINLLNTLSTIPGCNTKIPYPLNMERLVKAITSLDLEKDKIREILIKINILLSDPLIKRIIENVRNIEYRGFEDFENQIKLLFNQTSSKDQGLFFARYEETISFLKTNLSTSFLFSLLNLSSFLPFILVQLDGHRKFRHTIKDLISENELDLAQLPKKHDMSKHKLLSLLLDLEKQYHDIFPDVKKIDLSAPFIMLIEK